MQLISLQLRAVYMHLLMQVANALSPTANYAAGQRWFIAEQAAKEHARVVQHPDTDFDPDTGAPELHSALSSLNEAIFETAQVGRQFRLRF
jgi:hypothetical protein